MHLPPLPILASSALLLLPSLVAAHSNLAYIIINGSLYHGFDPRPGKLNPPSRVGWSSSNTDAGYVSPLNFSTPEIACHLSGASTPNHAPVRAGDRIHIQWNGWPYGHPGPLLSYLAPCENTTDGCFSVNKSSLLFTKIDSSAPALIGYPADFPPPGEWASHVMISNNNSWTVQIPSTTPPGPYVLRHEAIALHFANKLNGAQHYPLCMNLYVTEGEKKGGGGNTIRLDRGTPATGLYKADDKGIFVDVFKTLTEYVVPGPTVAVGAEPVRHEEQRKSESMRDGTPVRVVGTRTAPWEGVAVATGAGLRGRGRG